MSVRPILQVKIFSTSLDRYLKLNDVADHFFPPVFKLGTVAPEFKSTHYWREPLLQIKDTDLASIATEPDPRLKSWHKAAVNIPSSLPSTYMQNASSPVNIPSVSRSLPTTPSKHHVLPSCNSLNLMDELSDEEVVDYDDMCKSVDTIKGKPKKSKYWALNPLNMYLWKKQQYFQIQFTEFNLTDSKKVIYN